MAFLEDIFGSLKELNKCYGVGFAM